MAMNSFVRLLEKRLQLSLQWRIGYTDDPKPKAGFA
jgi:hypothetical protein